jgi:proton-dependent oligopeptide transporter, POT family
MSTHGVPNDVINNLDPFAILILIPIHDLLIYPFFNRIGIKVTPLRKITLGFFTGSLAMIWAAVVQHYIYKTSPCGYHAAGDLPNGDPCPVSPLNVWIQTGSYVLIGASEIYASITGLEYAFTKAPKNMKSLVMGMFLFTSAIAAAIGEAFVSEYTCPSLLNEIIDACHIALSTDPLLVWNYGVMSVLAFFGGIFFWLSFYKLDRAEDELNNLSEGHFESNRS